MKKKLLFFRIDEQVFTTMAVLSGLAVLVLAFRFKSSASCQVSGFTFSSGFGFYEGSPVVFAADAQNGKSFEWDFGDGSKQVSTTTTTTHIYKRAGTYTVVLLVNNQCGAVQNISIKEPRKAANNSLQAIIQAPDSATVGQPVTFADRTPNAKSREWWFGESGTVDATAAEWTYRYSTPGAKKIILQVNGDPALVTTHDIYVKEAVRNTPKPAADKDVPVPQRLPSIKPQPDNPPLPVPATPITPVQQTPPAPAMSEGDMSAALEDVVTGKKDVAFFAPYLCGELNIAIFFNGKPTTFAQMCAKLKEIKKVRRIYKPTVGLTKDGVSGCIKTMNVTVKSKSLLDRIF